jgi:hypothetical protein
VSFIDESRLLGVLFQVSAGDISIVRLRAERARTNAFEVVLLLADESLSNALVLH